MKFKCPVGVDRAYFVHPGPYYLEVVTYTKLLAGHKVYYQPRAGRKHSFMAVLVEASRRHLHIDTASIRL